MIRTLRITSIIAVVLAVVFFVLPAILGVRGDEQIEQFLNSAGAIEKFNDARGDRIEDDSHEISPLVKQAEAFALYLNPPPKPSPPKARVSHSRPRPRGPVAPKFKLVGTSYYALHPEQSLALIDEPGKGLRWVKQSDGVGHLVVEQVQDGLVVVRDGQRTFEVVAERRERKSLVKNEPSAQIDEKSEKQEVLSQEEIEATRQEALAELDAVLLELGLTPDGEPLETAPGTNNEKVPPSGQNQRISGRENMRISSEEAKKLGLLGRKLKDVQKVSTRTEADNTEDDANFGEPNLGDMNNLQR